MATFVKEATRGKLLYLLRLDNKLGDQIVYMDATTHLKAAEAADIDDGYDSAGPAFSYELTKAAEYADYVNTCATINNLHKFDNAIHRFFPEAEMPPRTTKDATHVRTDVSI